jgi:hypothetical protein
MNITYLTDSHLGINRSTHTTASSARLYRKAVYEQTMRIVKSAREDFIVHGGDLFDRHSNTEETIEQGLNVLEKVNLCIAGNHDVKNIANSVSSLSLCSSWLDRIKDRVNPVIFSPESFSSTSLPAAVLVIPHCWTQELFIRAIKEEVPRHVYSYPNKPRVVFLHCNYGAPETWLASETTLNLDEETAEWILAQGINRIIIGHEHSPRVALGSQVILPGSTFPTAFDNMEDKFIWQFSGDGEESLVKVWDKTTSYRKLDASELPTGFSSDIQFLELEGEVPAVGMLNFMKAVSSCWEKSPNLLAVKMSVKSDGKMFSRDISESTPTILGLRERISQDLASNSGMLSLWKSLIKDLGNE